MENSRFRFRVWDYKRKIYTKYPTYNYIGGTFNLCSCEDETIEQATGLKDKNGKLIYEGDWLKTKDGFYCYVVWFDGFCRVKSLPSEAIDLEHAEFYRECEVVGNIHDNPNFMEENNV